MELHKVHNNSYIKLLKNKEGINTPIGSPNVDINEILFFSHIDGMYSLCNKLNEDMTHGDSCHIAAWTEVEVIELDSIFKFEEIRENIGRCGYGKDGNGKYRESKLCDMSDAWIKAAIDYVEPDHNHIKYYKQELEYRKKNSIEISDTDS